MRYIVFGILVLIIIVFSLPIMLICSIFGKDEIFYKLIRAYFIFMLRVLNVQVNVHGKVPSNLEGTLVVSNHNSFMDILILISVLNDRMIFVSKHENKRIFIISLWMKVNKTIFIKRENLKDSIKEMLKVTEFLKNGYNVMIFPQGTRDPHNIDFKSGSFKFVEKAKGDILPIGLKGSNNIFSVFSYSKKEVEFFILETILYEEYKDSNLIDLKDNLESSIREKVLDE